MLHSLPEEPFPLEPLHLGSTINSVVNDDIQWRAYSVLSFLAHAYMWCDFSKPIRNNDTAASVLPAALAVPWCAVSTALDMPPILTYSTYNLLNWRRLDPQQPIQLGNICCLNNFLGGPDEEWFRLIHVEIEAIAAPVISILPQVQADMLLYPDLPKKTLNAIIHALQKMQATLNRMGEKCDPYIYYSRVRSPMSGWKNNPLLPHGLIYEGVEVYGNQPQFFYGETGAQSAILHALDAILGIQHDQGSWLAEYLLEMRRHMPPAHRQFISALEAGPSLRDVVENNTADKELKDLYNESVVQLKDFRAMHKAFAYNYIAKWSKKEADQQEEKGTGGSDFMPALNGYQSTTNKHLIS